MALSVISRPQGKIANMVTSFAGVVSSSGTDALITLNSHGLTTADFIYIDSNLSAYNGYWYVETSGINAFFIREYSTASNKAFVNSGTATFYKTVLTHNWSCVHLPIVYKLLSTFWPTNSADTVRTVSSISNDAGYVNLNLSGDIKTTGSAAELEFVKITGQNAGIYQIINWVSDSDITIDYPFVTGTTFAGSSVQYYYNNYHARIKVYAGLATSHYWTAQKPYTLILELKLVPDASGVITINISEYLKEKIRIDENNLALDTLPNDINAFTQFYITYAEAYDSSSGYSLATSVSSYTDDSAVGAAGVGYAVNAALPFKTQSSGYLDDYVSGLTVQTPQKFLTPFAKPTIFDGQYFDLAFILNSDSSGFYILEQYFTNGELYVVTQSNILDRDAGIYRHVVNYNGVYDTVKVSLYNAANLLMSEIKTINIDNKCVDNYIDLCWSNHLGGNDYWRFIGGTQLTVRNKKKTTSKNTLTNWPNSFGKHADTIMKHSSVESNNEYLLRSQWVTIATAEDISELHNSLTVQAITTRNNRRTVLIDDGSFNIMDQTDKLVEVSFKFRYTDDNPTLAV